jgi:conserved oligomeric Golgi complex subunit 4
MLSIAREIIERDYVGVMKKKLDDVYRGTGTTSGGFKADKENRILFTVSFAQTDSETPS